METRTVMINNSNGGNAAGTLHVRIFSRKDRLVRALGMLGLMWLLAAVSVLIPVAHFVLVPAFLLAGPVMAVMYYRITERNECVRGQCPTCGGAMNLPLDSSDRLPLWTYCPPAGDPIRVVEGSGAGPGH